MITKALSAAVVIKATSRTIRSTPAPIHKRLSSSTAFHSSYPLNYQRTTMGRTMRQPLSWAQTSFQQRQRWGSSTSLQATSTTSGVGEALSSLTTSLTSVVSAHPYSTIGFVTIMLLVIQFRQNIQRKWRQVKEESWIFGAGLEMKRVPLEEGAINDRDDKKNSIFKELKLLELNPAFLRSLESYSSREEGKPWKLMTLSQYMRSLRPKQMPPNMSVPLVIQREIESGLALGLLQVVGPSFGRALVPAALDSGPVSKAIQKIASKLATRWFSSSSSQLDKSQDSDEETYDRAGIPLSLMTILSASNLNAKLNKKDVAVEQALEGSSKSSSRDNHSKATTDDLSLPKYMDLSAIDKMALGEIVKGPSMVDLEPLASSSNFIISESFDQVITDMEERFLGMSADSNETSNEHEQGHQISTELELIKEQVKEKQGLENNDGSTAPSSSTYNPDDLSMAKPVPVNPRLFPDLHLGWGDAKCSHTKREVLRMRLIALLLNRLGSNYYKYSRGETNEIFSLQMTPEGNKITTPSDFIQALIESGHSVEVVPSSRITTFGVALCVKEDDNTWKNIPLAVFLESGYEDREGKMAPATMPHSGLDMSIQGPLAGSRGDGTPSELKIQHFIGIEGFSGWKSHENAQVPFNIPVEHGQRLSGDDAVRAARIAALYGVTLNGLATEMNLPFGGYGLTAVCNDSAAVVQKCLYKDDIEDTTIYPMTSIGRFVQRTRRYAQHLRDGLQQQNVNNANNGFELECNDLCAISDTLKHLPSDLNAAPGNVESVATRMLSTMPKNVPFALMNDAKQVMTSLRKEEQNEAATSANCERSNACEREAIQR